MLRQHLDRFTNPIPEAVEPMTSHLLGRWSGLTMLLLSGLVAATARADCTALTDHSLPRLGGAETWRLCERFDDDVLLIVNTASRCGFTPQFADLQVLHDRYAGRGLTVIGVPSNDFRQELAEDAAIQAFCQVNYGVTFNMARKQHVRGSDAHPLYAALAAAAGEAPGWNFHKYLIGRDGTLVGSFDAAVTPRAPALVDAVEAALAAD